MILLRDPDWPPTGAQHPHGLETIPVFPRGLTTTEGRSLQFINMFLEFADAVDVGLAPALYFDALEQLDGSKGIGSDGGFGLGPGVNVDDVNAAAGIAAVVIELGATRNQARRNFF
jgi:hypothetical protein